MTAIHLTPPDYVVIFGYFVLVLLVGLYFNRKQTAARDYFAAGHQVPWWLAGISHYMSSFSAFTFIAYSQIAYTYGSVAIALFWTTTPACAIGGLVFARRWRRARVITPVEFLEKRYNASLRQLFAWAGIPVKIFDDGLKVFATALILSAAVGLDLKVAIVGCGIVTVTYTLLGGLWALVVTDYVQFLMKIAAMLLLLPLAVWRAGGITQAFQGLPPGFLHLTGGPYGWPYLLSFTALITISYNATWALAQKYYSVPDEKSASRAAYLSAALNFIGTPLMLLPAVIGRKFLPDLIEQHKTADTYVLLVLQLLPVGMIGIIVAAMFSATMATVSADLNAIASVLTRDFYQRLLNPFASDRTAVRAGRLFTLALGVIVIGLSLLIAYSQKQTLFGMMVTVFGLFLAPTLMPILAGLTVRFVTWRGALAGFIAGLTTGAISLVVKTWYLPGIQGQNASYRFEALSIFLNIAMTALGLWLGSVLPKKDPAEQQRIASFFRDLDTPVQPLEIRHDEEQSARPALGAATVIVGALLALAGLVAESTQARWIDLGCGILLAGFGVSLLKRNLLRTKAAATTVLLCLTGALGRAAEPGHEWLLPNIAMRLCIEVTNPSQTAVSTLATVDVTQARTTAPEFPGSLAFALLLSKDAAPRPALFIPIQTDDLDRDGIPDQVHFPVELAAGETKHVDIYYSTTLNDETSWPKRVSAKHNYGYNREVAALESELIGYRTYGGFLLDFMGRSAGRTGLNNDLAGYVSIYRDLGAGRDVFHIGNTLGLGGVFLRRSGTVFQPPMNVPTYAHKPSPAMTPHYRVLSQGPLRASVEALLHNWDIDGDRIRLRAVYSIDVGSSVVHCHVEATPVRMHTGREYELGIGLRELPAGLVSNTAGQMIVTGRQDARDGDIGIALFFDSAQYGSPASVRTKEGGNHAVLASTRLAPGQTVTVDYAVAGAWSGSGISDLAGHLAGVARSSNARVTIGGLQFTRTPRPEKLEAEAQ